MKKMFKFYTRVLMLAAVMFTAVACEDNFLDINTDPNNPTTAPLSQLLTTSQIHISNVTSLSTAGLSSTLSTFMHQVTQRGTADQYGTQGSDFEIGASWNSLYTGAFEDLRVIIDQGTEAGDMQYVGIAKLLKAYAYSIVVDVWGNAPFTEANRMPDIRFPVFDEGADIYADLFPLVDEGLADLENAEAANVNVPGADDLIYGGNVGRWRRFGNTLKLRLYNQVRLSANAGAFNVDANVAALIGDGDLIESAADDFELPYGTSVSPENRHPGFVAEYSTAGAQKNYYVSIWFWQTMTGNSPAGVFAGVQDPRLPYYFFNQLAGGAAAQNPEEFRVDDFLSIHFGSIHPNQAQAQGASQTVLGLYPIGGRYDDGAGAVVGPTSAAGDVAQRMLPYFNRLFIEAELAHEGVFTGDARDLLNQAMRAALAKVNEVAQNTSSSQTIPTIGDDDIDAYVNTILVQFDAATPDRQLEIIMTQKWIANFGNAIDTYNDYRRTGYPVIFDPNTDTDPLTQSAGQFQLTLPWRELDLTINPNAPPQKAPSQFRVFWDPS